MKQVSFKIINNNKEIICDVIATYHDNENNKDFIIYTDKTLTDNGKLKIYYSMYTFLNNNIKLIKIKNLEDEKFCLKLIEEIIKENNI